MRQCTSSSLFSPLPTSLGPLTDVHTVWDWLCCAATEFPLFSPTRHTQRTHSDTLTHTAHCCSARITTDSHELVLQDRYQGDEISGAPPHSTAAETAKGNSGRAAGSGTCACPLVPAPVPLNRRMAPHTGREDSGGMEWWRRRSGVVLSLCRTNADRWCQPPRAPPTPMTLTPLSSPPFRCSSALCVCRLSSTCRQFVTAAWATALCM